MAADGDEMTADCRGRRRIPESTIGPIISGDSSLHSRCEKIPAWPKRIKFLRNFPEHKQILRAQGSGRWLFVS